MLFRSSPLRFNFVRPYQIEYVFYTHWLHECPKIRKMALKGPVIRDSLTNAWNNTNLRLSYAMKVDSGHKNQLWVSKICLCYSFVYCECISLNLEILGEACLIIAGC